MNNLFSDWLIKAELWHAKPDSGNFKAKEITRYISDHSGQYYRSSLSFFSPRKTVK